MKYWILYGLDKTKQTLKTFNHLKHDFSKDTMLITYSIKIN